MEQEYKYMVCTSCMTYNHAPYIVDAMTGFTMQETTFPVYYLITDDASTDGEPEVIKQYLTDHFQTPYRTEETDDYYLICAVHKSNPNCYFIVFLLKYNHYSIKKSKLLYQSEWRNNAKYIAMCEGDDYWIHPKKLQKQVEFLEKHPKTGLVYTEIDRYFQKESFFDRNFFKTRPIKNTHENFLLNSWFLAPCTWLYRRELFKKIPDLDTQKCFTGDILKLLTFSKYSQVRFVNEVTAVYRVLSISASHFDNPLQEMNFWLRIKNTRLYFVQDCSFVVKIKFAFLLIKGYAYRIKHNRNRSAFLVCSYIKDLKVLFF